MINLFAFLLLAGGLSAIVMLVAWAVQKKRGQPTIETRNVALASVAIAAASFVAIGFLALLSPASNKTPAPKPTLPPYLSLYPGQRAYLDTNSEGDGRYGTLFKDWKTVTKWASGHFNGPSDLPHVDLPVGTEVEIHSWRRVHIVDHEQNMIDVATIRGSKAEGWVMDVSLIPEIPSGTVLVVSSAFKDKPNLKLPLSASPDGSTNGPKIAQGTSVPLVSVVHDARLSTGLSMYYVRVMEGPHRGARGYFSTLDLSAPSNAMGGEEYDPKCHCVDLFFNESGS